MRPGGQRSPVPRGFTLIEMMVVVTLIGLTLALAIPALREVRRSPIAQATKDFLDACREARSRAILGDRPMQLVLRDGGGELSVEPAPVGVLGATNGVTALRFDPNFPGEGVEPVWARRLPDDVAFRSIVVNGRSYMDAAATAVRFHPNGTCDQFVAEIQWQRRETRLLQLEILTGIPTVEEVR